MDQERQRAQRRDERQTRRDGFLNREEPALQAMLAPVEGQINAGSMIDRAGNLLSSDERDRLYRVAMFDRDWYYRPNGQKERLREQPWAIEPATGDIKRDPNTGRKMRAEKSADSVQRVFHESLQVDPRISWMAVLAARDGQTDLITSYLRAGGRDTTELFERRTGFEIVDTPYHAKPFAGHYQPGYVIVDENHQKLGSLKKLVHLGKPMCAINRWRRMGFDNERLERLTGMTGAGAGLDHALKKRDGRAFDAIIEEELDNRMYQRLETPEFAGLKPYYGQAVIQYDAYLKRLEEAMTGMSEVTKKKMAELESASEKSERARQEAEQSRKTAEEKAAKATAEVAAARELNAENIRRQKAAEDAALRAQTEVEAVRLELEMAQRNVTRANLLDARIKIPQIAMQLEFLQFGGRLPPRLPPAQVFFEKKDSRWVFKREVEVLLSAITASDNDALKQAVVSIKKSYGTTPPKDKTPDYGALVGQVHKGHQFSIEDERLAIEDGTPEALEFAQALQLVRELSARGIEPHWEGRSIDSISD